MHQRHQIELCMELSRLVAAQLEHLHLHKRHWIEVPLPSARRPLNTIKDKCAKKHSLLLLSWSAYMCTRGIFVMFPLPPAQQPLGTIRDKCAQVHRTAKRPQALYWRKGSAGGGHEAGEAKSVSSSSSQEQLQLLPL